MKKANRKVKDRTKLNLHKKKANTPHMNHNQTQRVINLNPIQNQAVLSSILYQTEP